ncbi:MAG: alternative ribosome rescue aminoacyl-tRNA hydrolase ArfB [Roseovarius sp.]
MLRITDRVAIQDWELSEQFVRSAGPGGQNVNKVATAVELRFAAASSPSLSEPVKRRLRRLAGRRWSQDGTLIIQVDDTRSQTRNRAIARARLAALVAAALVSPRRRIATAVSPSQKRKRLEAKRRRAAIKAGRGRVGNGNGNGNGNENGD